MPPCRSSIQKIQIASPLRRCFWYLSRVLILAICGVPILGTRLEAQMSTRKSTPAGSYEQLSVHMDHVLVPSFMGFGVQLDPYAYPPTPMQWQRIQTRLELLQPAFLRVMFSANDYCRKLVAKGCTSYVWDDQVQTLPQSFQQLLWILNFAESHKIPVMLGEWSWPRLGHDEATAPINGPDDPRWAEIIVPLLHYLIDKKHYTVLRFYNYMNEPNGGWMWPGGDKGVNYEAWKTGLVNMRQVLDRNELKSLTLVGPDNSADWDWLDRTAQDASSTVGAWEMHWYPTDKEVQDGKIFRLLDDKRRMLLSVDPTASRKLRFMGEAGLITGRVNGDQQPRVRTFVYGVLMADYAAQIAQAGWMGASAWDLDDAMHVVKDHPEIPTQLTLKTWGFWNTQGSAMGYLKDEEIRPWFTPWLLLAHLFPSGAEVYQVSNPGDDLAIRSIAARSTVNGKQAWSIMLVNDHDESAFAEVTLPGSPQMQWHRYQYCETEKTQEDEGLPRSTPLSTGVQTERVELSPRSVIFLTNIDLSRKMY